jgi:hypothetical protein
MTVSFPTTPHRSISVPDRLTPLLYIARERVTSTITKHVSPLLLTAEDCSILHVLANADGPCSMREIDALLHYPTEIITACYTSLADRLLIEVEGGTVRITGMGMAFLDAAFDLADAAYKEILGDMPPEMVEQGMKFLHRLAGVPRLVRRVPVPITELHSTVAG